MDNNKFISLDDFTNVLNDIVTKINQSYVKKETNVLTRTVFIYKYSNTIPTVMPSSINWDVNQNIVTISAGEGWMLNTDEYDANGRALWMSSGTLNSLTPTNVTWAAPIRLTGERGPAGLDGTILEYKYRLTQNDLAVPAGPDAAPDAWTNTPSGVSLTNQAEWVSSRYKETSTSDFTDWSTPVIWAKYGVNGVDGNGYEYIYYRNNGEGVPSIPTYDVDSAEYQLDEYIPQGWNDDPQGVTAEQRYVWMSSRKKQNQAWGPFKTPSVWAKFGEKGDTGYLIKTLYTKTSDAETPIYVYNEVNPGSSWSSKVPKYNTGEYVWEIKAYFNADNEFVEVTGSDGKSIWGWSEPILISGIKGDTGSVPNYKVYVYKFATTQPNKPQTDSVTNLDDWEDYPVDMGEAEGKWWQCVGQVNGNTNLVMSWSDVIPLTGDTGNNTEFRFRITTDSNTPSVTKTSRIPNGWDLLSEMQSTEVPTNGALWQIVAEVNGEYLKSEWSSPVRISGEKGDTGAAGPIGENGPAGVPGSDMVYRYCLGTSTTPTRSWENDPDIVVNENFPYVWAEQGRQSYHLINGEPVAGEIEWTGKPFKFTGKDGKDGREGQLVYPAGAYDVEAAYECTADIAPYVYYDGEYYVMNRQMIWIGTEQNGKTPKDNVENDGATCWKKFESFQALHAQIGIIENGLIGSAVFNGDYMFSQWGICKDGTTVDEETSSEVLRSCFEKFNPNDPYGEDAEFKPNICFNLKTGKVWINAGKTVFCPDGSGYIVNGDISWGATGSITLGSNVTINWGNVIGSTGVVDSINAAQTAADNAQATADNAQTAADNAQATANSKTDQATVDSAISTSLSQFEIASHKITGNLLQGKTVQSNVNRKLVKGTTFAVFSNPTANGTYGVIYGSSNGYDEGPSWQIRQDGDGYLANGNIAWGKTGTFNFGDGAITYNGDTVSINGGVNINGMAIMAGITGSAEARSGFGNMVADTIDADTILGNEIVGKTVRSDNMSGGTATWILQNDGAGHLAKGNIVWGATGGLNISGTINTSKGKIGNWSIDNAGLKRQEKYITYDDSTWEPMQAQIAVSIDPQVFSMNNSAYAAEEIYNEEIDDYEYEIGERKGFAQTTFYNAPSMGGAGIGGTPNSFLGIVRNHIVNPTKWEDSPYNQYMIESFGKENAIRLYGYEEPTCTALMLGATGANPINYGAGGGNHALWIEDGMVAGFRPRTRRIYGVANTTYENSHTTLSSMDHTIICCGNNTLFYLDLPSNPKEGQEYEIWKYGTKTSVTICSNKNICWMGVRNSTQQGIDGTFIGTIKILYDVQNSEWLMMLSKCYNS